MAVALYASAAASTAFRLISYVFLRVIPATFCKFLLPALYVLYALPALFVSTAPPVPPKDEKAVEKKDEKANGSTPAPAPKEEVDLLWHLLFSFSTTSLTKAANFAINTLLLLAGVHMVLQPVLDPAHDVIFSRIGAVSPDSAKIVVRFPNTTVNATESTLQLLWRKVPETTLSGAPSVAPWQSGPKLDLTPDADWTGTAQIRGLWPNTQYEYALADTNKTLLDYPATPLRFRTFPDPRIPGGSHFRFLATSCITPNFPYVPFQGRTIKGFDYMAEYLAGTPKKPASVPGYASPFAGAQKPASEAPAAPPATEDELAEHSDYISSLGGHVTGADIQGLTEDVVEEFIEPPRTEFLMFLGDFIYADVPFYFGDSVEAYRRLYRRNYQSPSFRKVYEQLPIFHTYDDHEIIDNYAGKDNDSWPYAQASDAFDIYAANGNPDPRTPGTQYYDFRYGDSAYFVLDTRRYRSGVDVEPEERSMLGDAQLASLYEWLAKSNQTSTFKFIVSSVPFTSLWRVDAQIDSWAAYAAEKAALLEVLHTVPNVFIISGDRHEFASIEFNPEDPNLHTVREISTSPLNMFYIPLIHTLRSESDATVKRTRTFEVTSDVPDEKRIEEVEIEIPAEKVVKYLPNGNHKWATFEVDTTDAQNPTLKLDVHIDGKVAYEHTFAGTPVKLRSSSTTLATVTEGLRDMLGRVGFNPSSWF
ncbi:hypothetical protein PENSPDRAFT_642904 [Peniophora sp. CONT]|nr:hypothetical protein PENSPDRAFT_642904 [Peniophora sp. CONT]